MKKRFDIAVLRGDGIGPEVVDAALKVLVEIETIYGYQFNQLNGKIGAEAIEAEGEPLSDQTISLCKSADAILFGAIGDPKYDNAPDLSIRPEQGLLRLRKALGLYANIRPVSAYDILLDKSPLKEERIKGVDLVIYRELTGGIYFGEKGYDEQGGAFDHCTYSIEEVDRVLHLGFKAALARRKKLTLVDKANVLETSRLWRKRATALASQYPEVELDFLFVDNAAMQLILNPKQFDVVVTENMFGDILSDEASVIAGSIGLLASSSIGASTGLFEPIHGSYPQAKGKGIANPVASILSLAMLLDYLELFDAAEAVRQAVNASFENGIMTPDLDNAHTKSTTDVVHFIVNQLKNIPVLNE